MGAPLIQSESAEELEWLRRVERLVGQYTEIREEFEALKKAYIRVSIQYDNRAVLALAGSACPWAQVASEYGVLIDDAERALRALADFSRKL